MRVFVLFLVDGLLGPGNSATRLRATARKKEFKLPRTRVAFWVPVHLLIFGSLDMLGLSQTRPEGESEFGPRVG